MSRQHLDRIRSRLIELGRPDVRIIAVSKTHGPERIVEFLRYGQIDFGENRQNEAREKFPLVDLQGLPKNIRPIYHHIGPLQSGSARQIPAFFSYVHGVSSLSALEILARAALKEGERRARTGDETRWPIRYFVQVKLTGERSKAGGFLPDEVAAISKFPENESLRFSGFMTMGPENQDPVWTGEVFHRLRELRDQILPGGELSMGMSGDWELAVSHGATMIRLGTILFGERGGAPWRPPSSREI